MRAFHAGEVRSSATEKTHAQVARDAWSGAASTTMIKRFWYQKHTSRSYGRKQRSVQSRLKMEHRSKT
ncbi:hypothetical protein CGCF413_v011743 [Colletotrichum fructicola]|nr:hypothetical protein CGCF413_v011743 [Colletotrichum fructicola]